MDANYEDDNERPCPASLTETDEDREYWLSKTPEERFRGVELLRQLSYGYRHPAPRMERVLEVVTLSDLGPTTRGDDTWSSQPATVPGAG